MTSFIHTETASPMIGTALFSILCPLILATGCTATASGELDVEDDDERRSSVASSCGALRPGEALGVNESVASCDGRFSLVMQGDGNLVLYRNGGGALWANDSYGSGGALLVMQGDGNLVEYTSDGKPVWDTDTYGREGAWLAVQDDGNLVIYHGSTALWASGTSVGGGGSGGGSSGGGGGLKGQIYTVDGWMSLEDDYIPRVCTQENGGADRQALFAQAVAARTYLATAMRDHPTLGTPENPVGNGEFFQAYASWANPGCIEAAQATRGYVAMYNGQTIIANYVAGALWNADGSPGEDYSDTEYWVTYNRGKTGADVQPTELSYTSRSDNRGCMSQNGANWLSKHGYYYADILRYFYGADMYLSAQ